MKYGIMLIIAMMFVLGTASAQTKTTHIFNSMGGWHTLNQYKEIKTGETRYNYFAKNAKYTHIIDLMTLGSFDNLNEVIEMLNAYGEFITHDEDVSEQTEYGYLSVSSYMGIKTLMVHPNDETGYMSFTAGQIKSQIKKITKFAAKNKIEL